MMKLTCYYYMNTSDSYSLHLYQGTEYIAQTTRRRLNDDEPSIIHPHLTAKQSYEKRLKKHQTSNPKAAGYPIHERTPIRTKQEIVSTATKLAKSKLNSTDIKIIYKQVSSMEYWKIQRRLYREQFRKTLTLNQILKLL